MILPVTREVDNENDTGRTDLTKREGKEIQILGFKDLLGISKNATSVREMPGVPVTKSLSTKSFGILYRPLNSAQEFHQNKAVNSENVFKRSNRGAFTSAFRGATSIGTEEGINTVL